MKIEIFKTDVEFQKDANKLVELLNNNFYNYQANFDLEDCDNILRIRSSSDSIKHNEIIRLLNEYGFNAEIMSSN